MKVSYIVCTRNRAASLLPTLDSIAAQADAELVVVNNGSTDNTDDVIRRWAGSRQSNVKIVFEAKPGLAAARNAGIRSSNGHVLVFTDDDCRLNPNYGEVVNEIYNNDPFAIIGGRVELGDPSDAPVTILLGEEPKTLEIAKDAGGFLHGCNMTIPRAVIDVVGLFDERFGAGGPFVSAEDTDYFYRAMQKKVAVRFDPRLIVQHHHGRKDLSDIHKLKIGYAIGTGAMVVKHHNLDFIKPLYWEMKSIFFERLKGQRRPVNPEHLPVTVEARAIASGAWRAIFLR